MSLSIANPQENAAAPAPAPVAAAANAGAGAAAEPALAEEMDFGATSDNMEF